MIRPLTTLINSRLLKNRLFMKSGHSASSDKTPFAMVLDKAAISLQSNDLTELKAAQEALQQFTSHPEAHQTHFKVKDQMLMDLAEKIAELEKN
ncbi:MAG: hypothetical protein SFU25_10455 [Candidatus Caenarcaniphilales bacterium]|nr:hypothetical protein [Candidatus Caenarcaniphilales bacterium]